MKTITWLAGSLLMCSAWAQAAERSILVLDVSGSMWGQIDGQAKIEIARDALKTLVADWPAEHEVGLVAYGHRQKDDCNDIETLIPVGPLDVAQMGAVVDSLTPKGKTPLSAAVKQAAEALKYTEEKATVILVSDGVETCQLDPCTVGTELEKLGVDFTAHVIGFDVAKADEQQGLRCLAENTGGQFIAATNADELKTALEQTAKAVEPTKEPATPAMPSLPKATVSVVPSEVIQGGEIEIKVEGDPDMIQGANMHLDLYKVGKNVSVNHYYLYKDKKTGAYKTQKLRVPNVAGDFVVKLSRGNQRELLAEAPVKVIEANIQLVGPNQAAAGSKLELTLEAPLGLSGQVCLYPQQGTKRLGCEFVREDAIENYRPLRFTLPEVAGAYVFKFEAKPDKRIVAELPIQIGNVQP